MRLLRRNVPLSDNFFLDIHYCPKEKFVVGVLTSDGTTCQVLVDEQGKPLTGVRVVSVTSYDPKKTDPPTAGGTTSHRSTTTVDPLIPNFTPEQNKQFVQYSLLFIGALILLKILASADLASLYLLALPLLYLYAVQTCPTMDSFDAKKELKRVLRGAHLPEDHPNKPKGLLEELAARVAASVTTELATFPGYELDMTSLGGAVWIADVRVPSAKLQGYWVGAFNKWYYITSYEIPEQRYAN